MLFVNQLIGFGSSSGRAEVLVDRTTGSIIGDMTGGGGASPQSNCFDGTTSQALTGGTGPCPFHSAAPGYIGKTYGAGKVTSRVVVYGSNDAGFIFGANPSTTITLYGKASAPASGTDGTAMGSITFTDTTDESAGREITCTDQVTSYTNIWIYVDGGANSSCCAELVHYELL